MWRLLCLIVLFGASPATAQRVQTDLIALFPFDEGAGTKATSAVDGGTSLDVIAEEPGKVEWIAGGLRIIQPTIVRSPAAAAVLSQQVLASEELTVEVWVTPASADQFGPARIVALSQDTETQNLLLAQEGTQLVLRVNARLAEPDLPAQANITGGELMHLAATYAAGRYRLYRDGSEIGAGTWDAGIPTLWRTDQRLAFGNEQTLDRPWLGTLHLAALYDRALTQSELQQNYAAGPEGVAAWFVSTPNPEATCGDPYVYSEEGMPELSTDADFFGYSLRDGEGAVPEGAQVSPYTGQILWRPTAAQAGPHRFELVADTSAGEVVQELQVTVRCAGRELAVAPGCGSMPVFGSWLGVVSLLIAVIYRRGRRSDG